MGDQSAFAVEKRPDGVAVLCFDAPGESVNTLDEHFGADFEVALDGIDRDTDVKALVLASRKADFIVGAKVQMLQGLTTAAAAAEASRKGQQAMDRLSRFRVPVVAAIHGACLGGGLEVALACRERVASGGERTKLGLPECQLGLLPGAGGTQRLPRLVGVQAALDLMLTGKQVPAKKARSLGLVDEVVPEAILVETAAERALALAERTTGAAKNGFGQKELIEFALAQNPVGRRVLFGQAKKQLLKKTRGNYPAQEKILEVVQTGLERGMEAGLRAEAEAFGELVVSPQAEQLIQIFTTTTAMKKDKGVADDSAEPRPMSKIGVLGGGLMGAGIAYVTADRAKLPVRVKDKDAEGVGKALAYVRKLVDGRVKRRRLTKVQGDQLMGQVSGTVDYSGFAHIPLVVEAVFEDLGLKHRVLKEVEETGPEDVIFASNTSSIPIAKIAEGSGHPETVIGMHYFSPVEKMPLLEVIQTPQTAPWVTATCVALGKRQGKTVIVVNDGVGFYTSRILGPLMGEAAYLLSEGVPVEAIDAALTDWGFPVGPVTLLDEVGIDVAHKVSGIMHEAFGDRMKPPPGFERLVADQRFGRKNGKGFYVYGGRRKGKKEVDKSVYGVLGLSPTTPKSVRDAGIRADDIATRCALAMVNEAAMCFGEGILRSASDGDVGAVFGLGFPPFRGGPFRYVDALSAKEVVTRLTRLVDRCGARFKPAPVLVDMAESGRSFHGASRVEPGRHQATQPSAASASASV